MYNVALLELSCIEIIVLRKIAENSFIFFLQMLEMRRQLQWKTWVKAEQLRLLFQLTIELIFRKVPAKEKLEKFFNKNFKRIFEFEKNFYKVSKKNYNSDENSMHENSW